MMGLYYKLANLENVSLALGFFDGVHLAHQKLISKTVSLAQTSNIKSALITFLISPYSIITGNSPIYITKLEDRIKEIKSIGVDEIFVLDFEEFKNMQALQYIQEILIPYFHPKYVVTGFNHTFGLNKKGDGSLLDIFFNHVEIPPQKLEGKLISSTNIKALIKNGEIEFANKMLAKPFFIEGKVVKGAQIARNLGYKTANIIWDNEIIRPKYGVYSGIAKYEGKKYTAMINFGVRPTIDKDLKETLEVHLDNFDGNLYGERLYVEFLYRLRDEIKFSSFSSLKMQLGKDFLEHHKRAYKNESTAN